MQISVEVGAAEQRKSIEAELSVIPAIFDEFSKGGAELPDIRLISVPADFEHKVNDLMETGSYRSARGHRAVAKVIPNGEYGMALVFSPCLFTEHFDKHLRYFHYLHELWHVIDSCYAPTPNAESQAHNCYLVSLWRLFDEYYSIRKPLELLDDIFPGKSKIFKKYFYVALKGHTSALIGNQFVRSLFKETQAFRYHANVDSFLQRTKDARDAVAMSITYAYALMDHFPKLKRVERALSRSLFTNEEAANLIGYFRMKYGNDDKDVSDGLQIMANFMASLGVEFQDTPEGHLYVRVLDII